MAKIRRERKDMAGDSKRWREGQRYGGKLKRIGGKSKRFGGRRQYFWREVGILHVAEVLSAENECESREKMIDDGL